MIGPLDPQRERDDVPTDGLEVSYDVVEAGSLRVAQVWGAFDSSGRMVGAMIPGIGGYGRPGVQLRRIAGGHVLTQRLDATSSESPAPECTCSTVRPAAEAGRKLDAVAEVARRGAGAERAAQ